MVSVGVAVGSGVNVKVGVTVGVVVGWAKASTMAGEYSATSAALMARRQAAITRNSPNGPMECRVR